ncbi:ubiquitin-conjugating enzyme E2 G2 isoform X2 [Monodelphis domestica]|uniref:ubiquitin-conjugating enzyme E2 G2 isoform X2 n=1 Tax=Monodelphis domestica TaxID=13616 RepID=UPI0004435D29|nr:ubiquitin-conjugating enzyme E2 G2 isoform X2 [Monodelphis domestica]
MAGTALKRLMAEYKQLTLNPPEGIVAGPMNEENFFEWEALIMGPEDTCFEFGVFPAILSFPLDYPLSPPKMRFTCEMFHPNKNTHDSPASVPVCVFLVLALGPCPCFRPAFSGCSGVPGTEPGAPQSRRRREGGRWWPSRPGKRPGPSGA